MQVQNTQQLLLNKCSKISGGVYPNDWKLIQLGDSKSGEFSNGINKDKEDYGSGTCYVGIIDVYKNFCLKGEDLKRVNLSQDEIEIYQLQKDDLILDRSSNIFETVGYPTYFAGYKEPVVCSGFTFRFRPNLKTWDSKFLTYQLMSSPVRKLVISISTKSANSNVNQKSYKKIFIPRPPISEQLEIESILSNIGNLIDSYKITIETAKTLKKGLVQHLFIKGINHKKFKKVKWFFGQKLEIPQDWEVKKLVRVSKIIDSLHITPTYVKDGIPMIRSTEIKYGNLKLEHALKVTKEVYEKFTKNHKPQLNDIVMSRVGTYLVTSFVNSKESFCMGQNTLVIHPKINPIFLYYYMNTNFANKEIQFTYDRTAGQKTLSLKNIRNLHIIVPTLTEQEQIASILQKAHSMIYDLESKKDNLEKLKKSLMQKLLTGKIRVKI